MATVTEDTQHVDVLFSENSNLMSLLTCHYFVDAEVAGPTTHVYSVGVKGDKGAQGQQGLTGNQGAAGDKVIINWQNK